MNPTNVKLTIGAALTGLLLLGAGSLLGVSPAAADGPEVIQPGTQTISEVQFAGAVAPLEVQSPLPSPSAPVYPVVVCTMPVLSDQILIPLSCVPVPSAATATSAPMATVGNLEPPAVLNAPALQAEPALQAGSALR